jgi:AbrB family looped-hinge helix DNA binding protein
MRTTIDGAGRLVLPKQLRDRLGLRGGSAVEIEEREGRIEIRPADVAVAVDDSGGKPILRGPADAPPLTTDEVRSLVEITRR